MLASGKEELRNKVHEPLAGMVCQGVQGFAVTSRSRMWVTEVVCGWWK